MAKIHIKVTTGDEFTISHAFYGASGPMADHDDAAIQLSFLFTKMASIGTDQGRTINAPQIVYGWVED